MLSGEIALKNNHYYYYYLRKKQRERKLNGEEDVVTLSIVLLTFQGDPVFLRRGQINFK